MSANNVVWVMNHISFEGLWHVFYSGCMDNTPERPDVKDQYYKAFNTKGEAILYAHRVVDKIDQESWDEGFTGVEYGVCIVRKEITIEDMVKKLQSDLITKENAIKERLCLLEDKTVEKVIVELDRRMTKRSDGCYQFTYCNECLAYPMGYGCPNLTKGPVEVKKET